MRLREEGHCGSTWDMVRAEPSMVSQLGWWSSNLGKREKKGNEREPGARRTWAGTDPCRRGLRAASLVRGEHEEHRKVKRAEDRVSANNRSPSPPSVPDRHTVNLGL